MPEDKDTSAGAGGPPDAQRKLRLDQFLKFVGFAATGGQAKLAVQAGDVRVNGEVELRRGRGLHPGDRVETKGQAWTVEEALWMRDARSQKPPPAREV